MAARRSGADLPYTVTCSYDGTETLNRKISRIYSYQAETDNDDIEEDEER